MKVIICHASWMEDRKRTLARLLEQVPNAVVLSSVRREHAATWARRAWEHVAASDGPVAVLNDDVTVCPDFERVCEAMVEAAPHQVIALHTSAPGCETLTDTSWARIYWLTGPGYIMWPEHAKALLDYWAKLPHGFGPNEDNVAIQWAWERQEPFLSSIPAIVRHDTETKSSLGYDEHPLRSSNVDWENFLDAQMASVDYWRRGLDAPPFIENPWAKADSLERMRRGLLDPNTCSGCWSRTGLLKTSHGVVCVDCLARMNRSIRPRWRLFIGAPMKGLIEPEHMRSMLELERLKGLELVFGELSSDARHEGDDLVRVRSRMLQLAYQSDCTHLLFTDVDNAWDPRVVVAMLQTGKDFVQCPYLRRDGRGYSIRPTEKDRIAGRTADEDIQPDNTIEIEHTGLGLTLLSRDCMRRMIEHYGKADTERAHLDGVAERLENGDVPKGEAYQLLRSAMRELELWRVGHMGLNVIDRNGDTALPMTALFQLMTRYGVLMSEDASFATRWRDIGGKVWLYIGEGSPIAHVGAHTWQGKIEDLGFSRTKPEAAE